MLRDPSVFKWYVVTLLALVLYVYAVEVERRRWDIVLAGIAFWLMDWVNEIVNALVLHLTDRAAIWTITGDTAYLILIGHPPDRDLRLRHVLRHRRLGL